MTVGLNHFMKFYSSIERVHC